MYILAVDRSVSSLNAKYFGLLHYLIQHENKLLAGMRAWTTRIHRKRNRMNTNKVYLIKKEYKLNKRMKFVLW